MELLIIRFICVLFLIVGLIVVLKINDFSKLIVSDKFWLLASWEFCLLLYCFSGIVYPIKLGLDLFLYIILFLDIYLMGSFFAKVLYYRRNKSTEKKTEKISDKKIYLLPFFLICVAGTILYVSTVTFFNPDMKIGITRNVDLNAINTTCLVFSSGSLIIWLYELAYSLMNKKKITIYGVLSAILYNIPGIVIAGRDALMIFLISTFIVVIYSVLYLKKHSLLTKKFKQGIIISGILLLIVLFSYLFIISSTRYGTGENSVLETFEGASHAKFPKYLVDFYKNSGVLGKLVLNIVFYYSSQFSKLALIYDYYTGPYQHGLYQLHYVSRAINSFVPSGLSAVTTNVEQICAQNNVPGTKVFWGTIIEYSIYDFGRIGALIYSFILGFVIKLITIKNNKELSILNIITLTLICVGAFTTVEVSPIFDYFYIFPLIWLVLFKFIYRK